ncbi:BTAD domain-containing putative transcriptional regulator [Phytoactinopolyspora mesophila]|uniref:AAA family ATPase n=1 Tax=Phytoactinopolyspora mesophila TaxID=2650750 RepID=A0A7K3M227_9ACTN|nr:BTAD domain-containing putative transcriptional regulator [Phytoactinopolyspora mesophila]NDL57355.1 AAA family ATPase [Phytoactinopolyspora mesophila]
MRFGVLGPLAVWTAEGRLIRVPEVKVRILLTHLLISNGRVVPADRLIDDMWGANLPANPSGALQTRISQLRRVLDDAAPGGRSLVTSQAPGYVLEAAPEDIDTGRFQALVARAHTADDAQTKASLLADALALWRGPALIDFRDEDFARPEIVRLDELRLTAVEEQAEARLELGEHTLLADELSELVAQHPLRERLRAAQLRALYRAGRQSEALDSYRRLRAELADELGVDPSPELNTLYEAILRQDPQLAAHPPRTAARPVPGNLPSALTSLVGRETAVDEVGQLLDSDRLVTLTGPGGIGKTSLAIEAAHRVRGSFRDGAWLVELAGVVQPTGAHPDSADPTQAAAGLAAVAETVTAALNVRDESSMPVPGAAADPMVMASQLAEALRAKHMLVVLDNCEHVADAVATLTTTLLRAAPELRIVVTSQRSLNVTGERLWTVPPLTLPAPRSDLQALQASSAVQLFVERAAAAAPGFALDATNAEVVEHICRRLDGLPLALELAATRVRALGVHELAARLDDRFRVLGTGQPRTQTQHRTLRAMIEWSWSLLDPAQQTVLRRLAVHADGCTLRAAEAVSAGAGEAGEDVAREDVVDILSDLVDRSLVVVAEHSAGDGPRYRLLESVAAYAEEQLRAAGEAEHVRDRHRRYYLELLTTAGAHLHGPAQREWLLRLDTEFGNLRRAFESAVADGDPGAALQMANQSAWYWVLRGRFREGRRWLETACSMPTAVPDLESARATAHIWQAALTLRLGEPAAAPVVVAATTEPRDLNQLAGRARAEWFLSFARIGIGDAAATEELTRRTLGVFQAIGDQWGTAAALGTLAQQMMLRGQLAQVREHGEKSMDLFTELGDRWGQLHASFALGSLAQVIGRYDEAARWHRDGFRMAEELELGTEVSDKLIALGRVALLKGDYARADELHQQARERAAEQGYVVGQVFADTGLALSARRQGNLETAESLLLSVLDWEQRLDSDAGAALILAELGFVAEQRGDQQAALSFQLDGLSAARRTGDPRAVALALEGLAGALSAGALSSDAPTGWAARLLGTAAAVRESTGAPLPAAERGDVDRIAASVRAILGGAEFSSEFEHGRAAELEQCLAAVDRRWPSVVDPKAV